MTLKMVIMSEFLSRAQEQGIACYHVTHPAHEIMAACLCGDTGSSHTHIHRKKDRMVSKISVK